MPSNKKKRPTKLKLLNCKPSPKREEFLE